MIKSLHSHKWWNKRKKYLQSNLLRIQINSLPTGAPISYLSLNSGTKWVTIILGKYKQGVKSICNRHTIETCYCNWVMVIDRCVWLRACKHAFDVRLSELTETYFKKAIKCWQEHNELLVFICVYIGVSMQSRDWENCQKFCKLRFAWFAWILHNPMC